MSSSARYRVRAEDGIVNAQKAARWNPELCHPGETSDPGVSCHQHKTGTSHCASPEATCVVA
jgi:hypothetical protein